MSKRPHPRLSSVLRQLLLILALLGGASFALSALAPTEVEAQEKKKSKKKKKKKKAKKKAAHGAAGATETAKGAAEAEEETEPSGKTTGKPAKTSEKKTETAKPVAEEPERKTAATFKVETTLDQKEITRTRQADLKRDEAIEELKKLVPKAPASRKSEMIFRLAELYWEKSKYKYGLEMDQYEKAYEEWVEAGQRGKPPTIKDFLRESELIKQNALKLYEKVLAEYPTYERNDEVLFYLGHNEYETGNKDKAVAHYWTLIKQFPQSGLVPDAYLQLGEHFFNGNDVVKAKKAYERALQTKAARVYNYALYKLSWCDYNVQEYAEGIKKLKEVIDRSETASDQKSVQLKAEALGDLARFFSYVDEVETAFAYFKVKGDEEIAIRYTTRLGGLFHEQGKWNLEIKSYRMLIEKFPMNEKAPFLQASIVEAYSQLNKRDSVRKEVERLVDLYRPGTPWYKHHKEQGEKGKAALEYAYDLTESKLRDLVTEYHRDAQKRKDVPTYQLARDIYGKYLDAFSETDSAYQMRFFYAEVLWALQEWRSAAVEYERVATYKTDGKAKGQYAQISAYNQILAWEKIAASGSEKGELSKDMKIVEKKEKGKTDSERTTTIKLAGLDKDKTYTEEPIPEVEKKLSDACDLYFKLADPKDEELPAIKFKAAYLYFKHNHFVAAAERYFEVIDRWPGDKLAKKAAHLILDSLNVQKKWEELASYADRFKENNRLIAGDKKFKEEVQGLLEGATYLAIQTDEKKARELSEAAAKEQELGKVATRFSDFQKRFSESQYADKALFNAVLIYNQANELDHGIAAAELMQKTYKKSELGQRNHLLLAEFYERIADFSTSADLYAAFYDENKKHEKAGDALFNAGVYYQGLGDAKKAIAKFTEYTKEFASKDDAADVYWRICELHEAGAEWKKAGECYDGFRAKYKKAEPAKVFSSRYRYALTFEKTNKAAAALTEYKALVSQFPKLPKKAQEDEAVQLAGAHAAFVLLEPEYQTFTRMKVTLDKKALTAKLKTAEDLACVDAGEAKCKTPGKFLSILTYGNGDYGICALTRMGQVYRGVADAIRNAPLPPKLDEDQLEIYRAELDTVALGPEEKAVGAFENALGKAYELNIYNECTLTAQNNLKELNPAKFPDLQKRNFRGAEGLIVAGVRGGGSAPASAPGAAPPPAGADDDGEEGGEEGEEDEGEEEDGEETSGRGSSTSGARE